MNLDSYTVRKAVPRILVAAIGINISIYLCVAAVEVTNIFGSGIADLLTGPFVDPNTFERLGVPATVTNNTATALGGALIGGLIIGGLLFDVALVGSIAASAGLGILGFLVPLIVTVALISLAVMFTLIIRQALIVFLTIISPVAIALFILPGTEKYFKTWFNLFIKTLLVYPIISVIFAMSTVMGAILLGNAGDVAGPIGFVTVLAVVIVVFAPLVLIPFSFKLAGGAIGQISELANAQANRASGRAKERYKKWEQDPNSWSGKARARTRERRMESGATPGQIAAGLAGGVRGARSGQGFRAGYSRASGAITTDKSLVKMAELEKMEAVQAVKDDDDKLEALRQFTSDQDRYQYLLSAYGGDEDAAWKGVEAVKRAESAGSRQEMKRFAAIQIAGTGTGYNDVYDMNSAIIDAADGDKVLEGNMMAAARSKAQQARRMDLVAGFGTNMRTLAAQRNGATREEVNETISDNSLLVNGAGVHLSQRGNTFRNMVPAINRRIDNSVQAVSEAEQQVAQAKGSGDQNAILQAEQNKSARERELKQQLAATAALHDVASQVSPENAKELADSVLQRSLDLSGVSPELRSELSQTPGSEKGGVASSLQSTMFQAIDNSKDDPDFNAMRKEYGSSQMAQYRNAQAAVGGSPPDPTAVTGVQPQG